MPSYSVRAERVICCKIPITLKIPQLDTSLCPICGVLPALSQAEFKLLHLSEVLVMARRLIDRPFIESELCRDLRVTGTQPPEVLPRLRWRTTLAVA